MRRMQKRNSRLSRSEQQTRRIVVTATSPGRIVTNASDRLNGTQRMSSQAVTQPFTADCISLDMIGDIGTRSRPSSVVVGDGGSGRLRLLAAEMEHKTLVGFWERWKAQTHAQNLGQTGYPIKTGPCRIVLETLDSPGGNEGLDHA